MTKPVNIHHCPCKECRYFKVPAYVKPCANCIDGMKWKNFRRLKPKLEVSTTAKDFRLVRNV